MSNVPKIKDITWKDFLPILRISVILMFVFSLFYTLGVPSFAILGALVKNFGLIFIGFIILRAGIVAFGKSFRDLTSRETINSIVGIKARSTKAVLTTLILGALVVYLMNPVNILENAKFVAGWLNDITASLLAAVGIHNIWKEDKK